MYRKKPKVSLCECMPIDNVGTNARLRSCTSTLSCSRSKLGLGLVSMCPFRVHLDLAINSLESSCPVYLITVTCSVAMQKHRAMLTRLDMPTKVCFKYFVCPDISAPVGFLVQWP